MKLRKLFLIAVACVGSASFMMGQPQMTLPVDTAIRMGKLPNGLTYYVRYNNYPENHANFYIAQRVGSLQEEESQRGLAHFLEHMCFNGSENFKGTGVVDYTRTLGVAFGRDLNAYTGIDQTVYNINDVPTYRQSALDSCLLILKDWSNGLLLEDKEIDEERGVIHEEWRMRTSAMSRMFERNLPALYPGSKYGLRFPIGLMSVVDNFKYDELRAYYHKWYRPDNQAIIVVGDINVDYTVNKIKEMFSSIPAAAPDAAQVTSEPVSDNNEPIIVVDKDKEMPYSIVDLMYKHDPFPEDMKGNIQYMVYNFANSMISQMLNLRYEERSQDADCPYVNASAGDGQYIYATTKDAFTVSAMPKDGKTNEALKAALEEVMRARQYGFTATEYERAKADYLSSLEKRFNNRDKISTESYGRSCASNYLNNEPLTSIETDYQIMNMIAPQIPVQVINQMFNELVSASDTNMVVVNFNQEKDGATYPTPASLKSAIDAARAEKLEAYVDKVKQEPLMTTMPQPGKIVKETENADRGYKELTLSNGAKVILKKTDFKADQILYRASSKGGSSLYGKSDWANCKMFDDVIGISGLGNFDSNELKKALAGKNANVDLTLSTSFESLKGNSTKKDLETLFQLNYLYFTNIKKDQKAFDQTMSLYETYLKNKDLTPESTFGDSIQVTLNNHNWRDKPFDVQNLKEVDYDRVLQIAKERTANAADFTFYFVGSFDEKTIKPLIEQYIASLPAQPGMSENYKNVQEYAQGNVVNTFSRKMETPKPMSYMYWYNNELPYTLENSIMARAVGQLLNKQYLKVIREQESAAYSPGAGGNVQMTGDKMFTCVVGVCQMTPEKKDRCLDLMKSLFEDLATNIDASSLKDIQAQMIKDYDEGIKENSYWLTSLDMWIARGIDIDTNYKEIVNAMTPARLSKWIKDNLVGKNYVQVTMLPE